MIVIISFPISGCLTSRVKCAAVIRYRANEHLRSLDSTSPQQFKTSQDGAGSTYFFSFKRDNRHVRINQRACCKLL